MKVALLSRAILPRQMTVEELGEILELVKSGAGDAESKYQFVDVREEEELGKAKLDGKRGPSEAYRSVCTTWLRFPKIGDLS